MINKTMLLAAILTTSALVAIPTSSFAKSNCNRGYDNQQSYQQSSHSCDRKGGQKGGMGLHNGGQKGGMHGLDKIDRMAKRLGLSDEQQAEIKTIMESNQEAKDSLRERMIESRQALRALDTSAVDYDEKVAGIAETIAGLEKEKIVSRSTVRKQVEFVLTDEQKTKMAEMKGKMGKRSGKNSN